MTNNPLTQTPIFHNNPTGQVLLLRLEDLETKKCQLAASALSINSLRIKSLEEARRLSDNSTPTCLITPNDTETPRALQNPADRVFRRTTTVMVETEKLLVQRRHNTGRFAFSLSASQETVQIEIDSAIVLATELQWKWNTIEDFQRRLEKLTPDEFTVLDTVCLGNLNKQIAKKIGVSIRTIEQRRRRVFDKMEVESAITLAAQLSAVKALLHPLHRRDMPHEGVPSNPVINLTSALSNPAHTSSRHLH